ncbi:MAG: hypothetical protein JXN64_11965 [Spirochaetes bacterium]|nr:hypothetical protein [Spirochaetota bacterium]
MLASKEIKEEQLQTILNNDRFIDKKISPKFSRMPKLIYFIIALENTGNIPLNIGEIKLHYNNISINPMNADDLRNKYNSLPYAGLKFGDILSLYKSDTGELCDNDMDFSGDFVKYKGSILSGDKVFQIIAFNWIPVQIRKFNLSIVIKSDIIKKIIDFKLIRFEYRQSGKYYIKPVKDDISF